MKQRMKDEEYTAGWNDAISFAEREGTEGLFTKREIEIAYLIGLSNAKCESGKYVDELSDRLTEAPERIAQMVQYIINLRDYDKPTA